MGFRSILPVETAPAKLRFPPITESAPVAETFGSTVMFEVVVLRPIEIALGETGNMNLSNFKFKVVWAILKLAVGWMTPEVLSAGKTEMLPVVPNSTPVIVVALL